MLPVLVQLERQKLVLQTVKAVKVLAGEADAVVSSKDESLVGKRMTPPEGGKRAYVSLAAHCAPATDSPGEPLAPWQCQQDRPFLNVRVERALLR